MVVNLLRNKFEVKIGIFYRLPTKSQDILFKNLGRAIDRYSENHENLMFLWDFDTNETEEQLKKFLN